MERWFRKYGAVEEDGTIDWNDDTGQSVAFWDAVWEMMDIAEAKWRPEVIAYLRRLPSTATARARPTPRKPTQQKPKRSRRKT
jgi:hypothetical protein